MEETLLTDSFLLDCLICFLYHLSIYLSTTQLSRKQCSACLLAYIPEEGLIIDIRGLPCGCWELSSGSLEEEPVLLTSEPSLRS